MAEPSGSTQGQPSLDFGERRAHRCTGLWLTRSGAGGRWRLRTPGRQTSTLPSPHHELSGNGTPSPHQELGGHGTPSPHQELGGHGNPSPHQPHPTPPGARWTWDPSWAQQGILVGFFNLFIFRILGSQLPFKQAVLKECNLLLITCLSDNLQSCGPRPLKPCDQMS